MAVAVAMAMAMAVAVVVVVAEAVAVALDVGRVSFHAGYPFTAMVLSKRLSFQHGCPDKTLLDVCCATLYLSFDPSVLFQTSVHDPSVP
mmetsp:Transcript_61203/g.101839  ORF Transcript_61203/g.101839 Transcript_61203/m.101839 type:complete len:89 (-) Transcript_61203:249-515(-)